MQRRVLFLILLVAVVGSVASWWAFSSLGDWQVRPPRLSGRVWTPTPGPAAHFLFVTCEERQHTVYVSRYTYRTESYDRYALQVRRVGDGGLEQALALGDFTERQETLAPQILGVVGNVVWLWRDGPEARALPDLALRCDVARLQREAPAGAELLPQLPKGYAVRSEPRSFVMRGRDARLYTLDAASASLTPLAAADLPANNFSMQVEDRFDYLQPPGRSGSFTSPYSMLERAFLTHTGTWYGLLTDGERQAINAYPPSGRPYGDVARRLYRADYTPDGRSPKLEVASVVACGDERFLQAGFLIRHAAALWDVPDPSSTLVLQKALLGEAEPWQLTRLARDGSVPWRVSTGLADLGEKLDLGSHVLFVGQRDRSGSGDPSTLDVRQRLVWIDERSGAMRTLFVGSGDVLAPTAP